MKKTKFVNKLILKCAQKVLVTVFLMFSLTIKGNATPVGVTHMLPTTYTIEAGKLIYGTTLAYGVTNFLQVHTNVYQLLNDIPNAGAKLGLVDTPDWGVAATFEWFELELENAGGAKVATVTSYGPGLIVATALNDDFSWTNGVRVVKREIEGTESGAATSGINTGTTVQSEIGWLYQQTERKGNRGGFRALAAGVSYDTTYELFGFGLSHHWPGFQLGFHYYPGADEKNWIPIIIGGGSVSL